MVIDPTQSNGAAWRGAEAIVEVFHSLPTDTRREVGMAMFYRPGRFMGAVGAAVAYFSEQSAVRAVAGAIVVAVHFDEADELIRALPDTSPWSVVKAALALAIREGVDIDEFAEQDPRTATIASDNRKDHP
jgi:hypothetical protein